MSNLAEHPFGAIVELSEALGVRDINRLPGAWTHQVDEQWRFAMNGHSEAIVVEGPVATTIAPYHAFLWFNEWPAGYFSAAGGTMVAGLAANEAAFVAACREATARALVRTRRSEKATEEHR